MERKGFTLIEMLVVIGIIAILIGASLAGYSSMVKTADRARCQELVSNVATALTMLFQNEGMWPKRLAENGATDGKLDENTAYALVSNGRSYFSLTTRDGKLSGHDRFGIVTPWAQAVIKKQGTSASKSSKVKKNVWDFPGGPVVENLPCNAGDMGLIPGWATKIQHTVGQLGLSITTAEPEGHK